MHLARVENRRSSGRIASEQHVTFDKEVLETSGPGVARVVDPGRIGLAIQCDFQVHSDTGQAWTC